MAAIVTGCLGAVGGKVGELILRQFNYLYCFSDNITNLENEAENLKVLERDLQGKVQAARDDVRVITDEVETWLQKSNDIKCEIDGILNEEENVGSGCFSLGARFSLSKRAEETTERLKELLGEYKFDTNPISLQRHPAAMPIPSEMSYDFDSRKNIEDGIMATLREGDVNMMGICGMGGLGKTTMARRIKNRALREHVFEEVAMVVVSQPPIDKLKIQLEIGGSLGLKLQGECSEARVQKLHKRLSGTKRILLILDDVWESFKPEDLGIPRGCTILLTSRNHDVLNAMNVQKIFGMEELSEDDSWFLFRQIAGTCVDELNSEAKEVVNECKGLPIALTTVGAALKDEVRVRIWKDALVQLRQCDPDTPELISNVYNSLKLSYDKLGSKQKSVFLLCCLFPEDANIPLEDLTYFCMGLRIFERGIRGLEEARNRMLALIKMLKSRSLLLDSKFGDDYVRKHDYVRMHDVVRDVCIYIAKQEGYIGDNDLTSSLKRYKLHSRFELLQIRNSDEEINFDEITDLHVLSIEWCSQLTSLPFTQMLRNLNTLVLSWCLRVTLSVVGELVNLEILICRDCYSIEELPPEIKGLKQLKVLDLTECRNLQRIGRGIISSLVQLEELKMLGSFTKWEGEDREGRENAGLKELGQLTKLRCLEIEIEDLALAADLSSEVDRFTIRFSGGHIFPSISDKYLPKRKMSLDLKETTSFEHWKPFLRETECLILSGNGANKVCLPELEKIRHLELIWCESMKNVVTSMDDGGGAIVFPSIEHLTLLCLPNLEEICDRPVSLYCFKILKELKLDHLPALKQLWKNNQNDLGKDFLPQLEVLEIKSCEMMEGVFLWKGEDGNENNSCHPITKRFPKLKEVLLYELPNLISLCQGIESIEFPLLRKFVISKCRKMKGMVSNGMGTNENNSGGSSSNAGSHALFCPQQVSFGCLKKLSLHDGRNPFCSHTIDVSLLNGLEELSISKCAGSLSLFTSSMAGNLVNLKELFIKDCYEMVEVIKDDEEKGMSGGRQRTLLFPKLQMLWLGSLPELVSFCEWKCDIEFPSLSFFHGNEGIEFPLLRRIYITKCEKMKGMVANGMSKENNSGGRNNNAADTSGSQQVSFGCLKSLTTERNPFCSHTIDHVYLFNGLEWLTITECAGSRSLFTFSIARNLVNLKELKISECDEMVEVIKDDEEKGMSGGRQRAPLPFPKLQKLRLKNLSKLVSFCELKCDVEFPSLRIVEIRNCPNMKTLGSLAAPKLESFKTDLKDDLLLQVPFNTVKELWIKGNKNPLNCYQIEASVFDRLEVLTINHYYGSMSLFSSSITENLVNLTTLTIEKCFMVKVIEDKEEEKEKVVSGAQGTTILFPKLQKIELDNLPSLVRFCEWKCDVELPSLTELRIYKCKYMQRFTLGPLNTPKLESVKIDMGKFGGVKDLNELVQQRYLRREEEKLYQEKERRRRMASMEIKEEQN